VLRSGGTGAQGVYHDQRKEEGSRINFEACFEAAGAQARRQVKPPLPSTISARRRRRLVNAMRAKVNEDLTDDGDARAREILEEIRALRRDIEALCLTSKP
jgi:hypothetical protein